MKFLKFLEKNPCRSAFLQRHTQRQTQQITDRKLAEAHLHGGDQEPPKGSRLAGREQRDLQSNDYGVYQYGRQGREHGHVFNPHLAHRPREQRGDQGGGRAENQIQWVWARKVADQAANGKARYCGGREDWQNG